MCQILVCNTDLFAKILYYYQYEIITNFLKYYKDNKIDKR